MTTDRYIYLLSNDLSVPGNTAASFRTRLAETLRFNTPHEVGLVEVQFTKSWSNVRRTAPGYLVINDEVRIAIPSNHYEIPALVSTLNTAVANKYAGRRTKRQVDVLTVDDFAEQDEPLDVSDFVEEVPEDVTEIGEKPVVVDIDHEQEWPSTVADDEPTDIDDFVSSEEDEPIDVSDVRERIMLSIDEEQVWNSPKHYVKSPSTPPPSENDSDLLDIDDFIEQEPFIDQLHEKLRFRLDEKRVLLQILSSDITSVQLKKFGLYYGLWERAYDGDDYFF
jgi:hypothetical protein